MAGPPPVHRPAKKTPGAGPHAPRRANVAPGVGVVPALLFLLLLVGLLWMLFREGTPRFNGPRAFGYVEQQVAFGPRVPGSEGHAAARAFFLEELGRRTDAVREHRFTFVTPRGDTLAGVNIVASFEPERAERVVLAAHYDTRPEADRDPDPARRRDPVPGANDGASGVAVLLELARHLAAKPPPGPGVDLVLFDLEDLGEYAAGVDPQAVPFAIGSEVFVRDHPGYRPAWGVLVDMVGDRNLRIPQEAYSLQYARPVVERVWRAAERVGASAFVRTPGGPVVDDHVPFLRAGIPMANLIHQPFPDTWHTTRDTPEFVSVESLQQVGDVLVEVLWGRGE